MQPKKQTDSVRQLAHLLPQMWVRPLSFGHSFPTSCAPSTRLSSSKLSRSISFQSFHTCHNYKTLTSEATGYKNTVAHYSWDGALTEGASQFAEETKAPQGKGQDPSYKTAAEP